ncbi:MAG: amino acid permease [Chloroflexota bacterium]
MASERSREVASPETQVDEQIVRRFGYKQELNRALSAFASFAIAFSVISITTGIFTNYGIGVGIGGPVGIWSWVMVGIGQIFVGLVIAELAGRVPLAGAGYQWSSRLVNIQFGWFIAFSCGLIFIIFVTPVMNLAMANIIVTLLGVEANPIVIGFIATALIAIEVLINIFGVRLLAAINNVAVITEIVGTVGIALIVLVVVLGKPVNPPEFLFMGAGPNGEFVLGAFLMAAIMGMFTLVGFEAAANLGEETKSAHLTVPKAINVSIISSVVFGLIILICFTIAIPDLAATLGSPSPLAYVIQYHLGEIGGLIALLVVLYSMFACILVGTTSTSRFVYSLSRDNMLPWSSTWSRINRRWQTPINALALMGCLNGAMVWVSISLSEGYTLFAGMSAVLPFLGYWAILVAYLWKKDRLPKLPGAFDMGKWSRPVNIVAILWMTLGLLLLTVPEEFHMNGLVSLGAIVSTWIWYLALLHGKVQRGEAGPGRGFEEEAQFQPRAG